MNPTNTNPVEEFGRFVLLAMEAERNWSASMSEDFCAEAVRLGLAQSGEDGYFTAKAPTAQPRDQWELCECCGSEHVSAQAWYWLNEVAGKDARGRSLLVATGEEPLMNDHDHGDAEVWCHECESEVRTVTVDHAAEGFQMADTSASDVFYTSLDKLRAGCGLWPQHAKEVTE
jgi:hypothetical protein